VLTREFTEAFRERVVHPEPALEIDLTCRVSAFEEDVERLLRRLARREPGGADADPRGHAPMLFAGM
jgi:hypothetical protein